MLSDQIVPSTKTSRADYAKHLRRLHITTGLTYEEIAEKIGKSIEWIKETLKHG